MFVPSFSPREMGPADAVYRAVLREMKDTPERRALLDAWERTTKAQLALGRRIECSLIELSLVPDTPPKMEDLEAMLQGEVRSAQHALSELKLTEAMTSSIERLVHTIAQNKQGA